MGCARLGGRRRNLGAVLLISLSCIYIYKPGFDKEEENLSVETEEEQEEEVQQQHVQFYSLADKYSLLVNSTMRVTYQAVPSAESSYQIPLVIHFLWIGGRIQEEYVRNMEMWVEKNSKYQVILWTDNVTITAFTGVNTSFAVRDVFKEYETFSSRDIIDSEDKLVCKADILRYEIMYKYGGVYSDVDSWSVQPLGPVFQHSFVALMSDSPHYIQNCIFGFPPTSQFMKYVLAAVRGHFQMSRVNKNMQVSLKYGPVFFTTVFVKFGDDNIHVIDGNFVLAASGDSVVVQWFDGNWWGKKENDFEDEEMLNHAMDRVEQKHKEYIEDMEYEDEIAETYL